MKIPSLLSSPWAAELKQTRKGHSLAERVQSCTWSPREAAHSLSSPSTSFILFSKLVCIAYTYIFPFCPIIDPLFVCCSSCLFSPSNSWFLFFSLYTSFFYFNIISWLLLRTFCFLFPCLLFEYSVVFVFYLLFSFIPRYCSLLLKSPTELQWQSQHDTGMKQTWNRIGYPEKINSPTFSKLVLNMGVKTYIRKADIHI